MVQQYIITIKGADTQGDMSKEIAKELTLEGFVGSRDWYIHVEKAKVSPTPLKTNLKGIRRTA